MHANSFQFLAHLGERVGWGREVLSLQVLRRRDDYPRCLDRLLATWKTECQRGEEEVLVF